MMGENRAQTAGEQACRFSRVNRTRNQTGGNMAFPSSFRILLLPTICENV